MIQNIDPRKRAMRRSARTIRQSPKPRPSFAAKKRRLIANRAHSIAAARERGFGGGEEGLRRALAVAPVGEGIGIGD